eukprot:22456-Hanusia_phi.AAC.2
MKIVEGGQQRSKEVKTRRQREKRIQGDSEKESSGGRIKGGRGGKSHVHHSCWYHELPASCAACRVHAEWSWIDNRRVVTLIVEEKVGRGLLGVPGGRGVGAGPGSGPRTPTESSVTRLSRLLPRGGGESPSRGRHSGPSRARAGLLIP